MNRLPLLYLLFFVILFTACKKDFFNSIVAVEVPEHESQLTVTATLYGNVPKQFVFVNHSQGILDSMSIRPVQDATVELFEEEKLLKIFDLHILNEDRGISRYEAENISYLPNTSYTLKVQSPQYGTLQGTQQLPTKVPITNATYEEEGAIDRYGERGDEISVEFVDPQGEKNYYVVEVSAIYTFEGQDTSFTTDWYVRESPVDPIIEEVRNELFFSDAIFDGKSYTIKFAAFIEDYRTFRYGENREFEIESNKIDGLNVTLFSVSKDYYSFRKSLSAYLDNDGNFFAEPTNVYENVEGGIGIFTLNTRDEFTIKF